MEFCAWFQGGLPGLEASGVRLGPLRPCAPALGVALAGTCPMRWDPLAVCSPALSTASNVCWRGKPPGVGAVVILLLLASGPSDCSAALAGGLGLGRNCLSFRCEEFRAPVGRDSMLEAYKAWRSRP